MHHTLCDTRVFLTLIILKQQARDSRQFLRRFRSTKDLYINKASAGLRKNPDKIIYNIVKGLAVIKKKKTV